MKNRGINSGGALSWFLQRITGAIIFIFIIVHFILMHAMPTDGMLDYNTLVERLSNPFYQVMQILFLVSALYHGLTGSMILIHDYVHKNGLRMVLVALLWLVTAFLLIYGILTVLSVG